MKRFIMSVWIVLFLLISCARMQQTSITTPKEPEFQYGFIDKTGRMVIEPQFDYAEWFSEGLAAAKYEGQFGYIDKTGQFVIKPQFSSAYVFSGGLAVVSFGPGKGWNYIDQSGKLLFDHRVARNISSATNFSEEVAWIKIQGRNVLINQKGGEWEGNQRFFGRMGPEEVREFREGFSLVKHVGRWMFFSRTGRVISLPLNVTYGLLEGPLWGSGCFSEGMAYIKIDGKYGFIDKKYDWVEKNFSIKPQFDDVANFREGLAVVKINNKFGYIDKTGKFIIPPQFDNSQSFSEGMAGVKIGNKYGYIDKAGRMVVKPQFDLVEPFAEGMGKITVGGKIGFVDKTGKIVIEPKFDYAFRFAEGLAPVGIRKARSEQGTVTPKAGLTKSKEPETVSQKAKDIPCPGDSTGLVKAVIDRQIDKVKSLLGQGIKPDQRDTNCYTPLIWAGGHGDYEIVKLLLDKGADINAFNRDEHTALTFTVLNLALGEFKGRHIDVIKLLIEKGANINWKSIDGTALKIAEDFNLKEAVDVLKKAGAKK
jgi:hypothetical protein